MEIAVKENALEERYNININVETLKKIEGFNNIPDNWVLWGLKEISNKSGEVKLTKPPINPMTLNNAMSDKKITWNNFKFTIEQQEKYKGRVINGLTIAGIGLMLPNTKWIFVDLDHCIDGDGNLSELSMDIITSLNSYTEISPSGEGVRIILKDDDTFDNFRKSLEKTHNKNKNSKLNIEVYSSKDNRYCTLTGNLFPDLINYNTNNNMAIKEVYNKYWVKDKLTTSKPSLKTLETSDIEYDKNIELKKSPKLDDKKILIKLRNQKNGQKFIDIFDNGDCLGDNSSADMTLMNMICFYTQYQDQVIRIYSQSKHHANRDKDEDKSDYETKRGQDYINRTFESAINSLTATYQIQKKDNTFYYMNDEGKEVLDQTKLRDHLRDEHFIFNTELGFMMYEEGIYNEIHTKKIAKLIELHVEKKDHREKSINEVIKRLEREFQGIKNLETFTNIINLNNCYLEFDIKNATFEMKEHTPKKIFRMKFPINYNPAKKSCSFWTKFLNEVLPEEQQTLLQEICGYMLIGDNRAKRLFALLGKGDCGKSVILTTLNNILGKEHVSNLSWQKLAKTDNRFVKYGIYNKLVNISGDLPQRALEDTGILKEISGDDVISAEIKGVAKEITFQNTCRLFASMNKMMASPTDKTDAWYNRFLIIPFEIVIPEEKQDKHLIDKFDKEAVLNWCIEGLQRLLKNKLLFSETEDNKKIIRQYKIDNDSVLKFIEECCNLRGNSVGKDLYNEYTHYCTLTGLIAFKRPNFESTLLNNNFIQKDKHCGAQQGQGQGTKRGFKGIELNSESEYYEEISTKSLF
jgi:putative DNA primase/helicase